MGDIGAIIKGFAGILIGAGTGAAHGVIDGYGNLSQSVPNMAHEVMKYGPTIFSGIYVGTESNGQWTLGNMISGGIAFAGLTAISTSAGYVVGRVISGGVEKLIS